VESWSLSRSLYRGGWFGPRAVEDVFRPGLRHAFFCAFISQCKQPRPVRAHWPHERAHVNTCAKRYASSLTCGCIFSFQACYSDSPAGFQGPILSEGSISITTKEALNGNGVIASYEIFQDFPSNFVGCRAESADACGTLGQSGSTSASSSVSVQLDVAFGMSSYLVVIRASGFYTVYAQVNLAGGQTRVVRADMVAELAANQDRVVLSWGSSIDLDLWVIAKVVRFRICALCALRALLRVTTGADVHCACVCVRVWSYVFVCVRVRVLTFMYVCARMMLTCTKVPSVGTCQMTILVPTQSTALQ